MHFRDKSFCRLFRNLANRVTTFHHPGDEMVTHGTTFRAAAKPFPPMDIILHGLWTVVDIHDSTALVTEQIDTIPPQAKTVIADLSVVT